MRTREAFLTLMQELDGDISEIKRLEAINIRAWVRIKEGATDILDYGALAFTIHNIYSVLENYFLRISRFFENNLPADSWHKTLIERMALEIPSVRPALIDDNELKNLIIELLRFRHKFRNLYGENLKPENTAAVQRTLTNVLKELPDVHGMFRAKLSQIAEKL